MTGLRGMLKDYFMDEVLPVCEETAAGEILSFSFRSKQVRAKVAGGCTNRGGGGLFALLAYAVKGVDFQGVTLSSSW